MISDEDIQEILKLFIEVANGTNALDDIISDYTDRSLGIQIYDSKYSAGILFDQGKLRSLKTLDRPTCIVTTDKNTFWKVINIGDPELQRLAIYTAFFTERTLDLNSPDGDIQIHSENLIKIFSKIAEVTS